MKVFFVSIDQWLSEDAKYFDFVQKNEQQSDDDAEQRKKFSKSKG